MAIMCAKQRIFYMKPVDVQKKTNEKRKFRNVRSIIHFKTAYHSWMTRFMILTIMHYDEVNIIQRAKGPSPA